MAEGETFFGILRRLARDTRGNTLVLTAALTMPMAGLVGGGIDMSRMYLVKTRAQHACDAGALSGRKIMGTGSWSANSNAANAEAVRMFDANFKTSAYGTGTKTKSFAESGGVVTGTASVVVPMTMMKIFGITTRTISVTCDAEMKIPNTDVMFVLDNTGSMDCDTDGNNCGSAGSSAKMVGLKKAVKCFYEALQKVNTTADCGSTPSGSNGSVQIRYGFVPYAVNVNVGKLLPTSYLADSWYYQSREANFVNVTTYPVAGTSVNGPYWETYGSSIDQTECLGYMNNTNFDGSGGFSPTATSSGGPAPTATVATTFPDDGSATSGGSNGEWGWTGAPDTSGTNRSCRRKRTDTTTTYTTVVTPTFSTWTYKNKSFDISGLKNGSSWNSSVNLPIGSNGANTAVSWTGCIEERRPTVINTDGDPSNEYSPIPSTAYDMNIDLIPTSASYSLWGPSLPGAVWGRYSGGSDTQSDVTTASDLDRNYNTYSCPTEAKKLAIYSTATNFETYVDSLYADANTYHDIGMIWGARFLSPTGIFASENAFTPSGGQITRHLIFMTDGDTNACNDDYTAYGLNWWDRRETSYAPVERSISNPYTSCGDSDIARVINARLSALCTSVKNMNITLWVIAYGNGTNATTNSRLSSCATTGKYFLALNTATLISNFQQIAAEISELRLTQ